MRFKARAIRCGMRFLTHDCFLRQCTSVPSLGVGLPSLSIEFLVVLGPLDVPHDIYSRMAIGRLYLHPGVP